MTNRERFHATLEANPAIDRSPVIEWATWWRDTVHLWEDEGLPKDLDNLELSEEFGLDPNIQFWMHHYAENRPNPKEHGAPLIVDRKSYLELKPYLFPKNAIERIKPRIQQVMPLYQNGSGIFWYTLDGFFWFHRVLFGIENHLYAFYDFPTLYHEISEDLLTFHLRILEEFGQYIHADFMTLAEDMSYNLGTMISEDMFDEFMKPYYEQLIPAIKKQGTKVIVDSDGDISDAVSWFAGAGVDGILPLERQAGVDIAKLQQEFPEFCWIGGFDKMCLLEGKEAIDVEIQRILPLLRKGRYLPGVDHQTPPGVALDDYRYYVQQMKRIAPQACKDVIAHQ